jgi:hypothetical protein
MAIQDASVRKDNKAMPATLGSTGPDLTICHHSAAISSATGASQMRKINDKIGVRSSLWRCGVGGTTCGDSYGFSVNGF